MDDQDEVPFNRLTDLGQALRQRDEAIAEAKKWRDNHDAIAHARREDVACIEQWLAREIELRESIQARANIVQADCDRLRTIIAGAPPILGAESICDQWKVHADDLQGQNNRYRNGFRLLYEMAEDYKTPWVAETLRHNPLFASLFEDMKVQP